MLKVGDVVEFKVNHTRRSAIRANHSATHLLHKALQDVLGEHVAQKGSLQDAERTRFDISQPTPITAEQLETVEKLVNDEIRANTPVETRIMGLDEARATGAMALFGEKYDDEVRVVSMGQTPDGAKKPFSVELCGGTHVKSTGEIGRFKIISESSLSSGVRRLEARTGARVDKYEAEQKQVREENLQRLVKQKEDLMEQLQSFRKFGGTDYSSDFSAIIERTFSKEETLEKEIRFLQKALADRNRAQAAQSVGGVEDAKTVGNVKFLGRVLKDFPAKDLKPMVDEFKQKLGSGVVVLIATADDKASIVVGVTADLTDKINAVELVKIGAQVLGGQGGGGRPDMAQAGGPLVAEALNAIASIEKMLQ